ncbi:hypothetical protein ABZ567_20270 [Streptomyces sp. NPDC016459]|uniref:hypothetical protein n=1 Tax=Streptomyces sp. NPDC016459 TaxID=3157190 RepID=UPI0033C785F6
MASKLHHRTVLRTANCGYCAPKETELTDDEVEGALALMKTITEGSITDLDVSDRYTEALLEVIQAKAEHRALKPVDGEAAPAGQVVDLMAGLEKSVADARERRGETGDGGEATVHDLPAPKKKTPAKKAPAKRPLQRRRSAHGAGSPPDLGLERGLAPVPTGLTLSWNSAVVEGHVNRIRMIKRSGVRPGRLRRAAEASPPRGRTVPWMVDAQEKARELHAIAADHDAMTAWVTRAVDSCRSKLGLAPVPYAIS